MRLKDKMAIITGGGHGMGEAEARLFAAEGARVMVADIPRDGHTGHTQAHVNALGYGRSIAAALRPG